MIFLELISMLISNQNVEHNVRQIGFVLEMNVMKNGDSLRDNPMLDEQFRNITLNESEIEQAIAGLDELSRNGDTDKVLLAWALGKSYNPSACSALKYIADTAVLDLNDRLLYQSLIGIENCCLQESWSFIEKIATMNNLSESTDFANQRIEYRKMGMYDG